MHDYKNDGEAVRKVVSVILSETKDIGGGSYLALSASPPRDSSVVSLLQNDIFRHPLTLGNLYPNSHDVIKVAYIILQQIYNKVEIKLLTYIGGATWLL